MVEHDDHLGEHHLPEAPDRVDDLLPLSRIFFTDGNNKTIMERALPRQANILDLGKLFLNDRRL